MIRGIERKIIRMHKNLCIDAQVFVHSYERCETQMRKIYWDRMV